MGNNDNRVVTWEALNSFITQNGGSPKKSSGANSLALKYGEFSEYAPMATATSSGVVISDYTGIGGGAYTSNQLVIEKDVSWFSYVRPVPSNIEVSPKRTTLDVGTAPEYPTSVLHTATVTAPADADKSVTWTISDSTKASIDQTGKVTAIAEGTVTVTATTSNGLSDTATVTIVRNDAPVIINPTSITVIPDAELNPGQTQQLTATVLPVDTTDKSVTWSSENDTIATVDQNGLVTAKAIGVVKIYATSNADPSVKGYATITVVDAPVTRYNISWSGDHASIPGSTSPVQQNEGTSWSSTFVPENGYLIDNITYTGQNVSKSGNTVTVSDLRSDVTITVTTSQVVVPVNRYTISMVGEHVTSSTTIPVTLDEGSTWSGTFTPSENYQIDSITYTGNNVQKDGNTVSVSNLTSDVVITITTSQIPQPVEITLDADDVELTVGESKWIPWELSDSSVEVTSVTYDIEDESIATMSTESGYEQYVVGVSVGLTTAVVTVNGKYTDTVTITVKGALRTDENYETGHLHDIFGNRNHNLSLYYDLNGGVLSSITDNQSAFQFYGVLPDAYNTLTTSVEYSSDGYTIDQNVTQQWITGVQIVEGNNGPLLKYTVLPHTEATDAIKEYISQNQNDNGYVNRNIAYTTNDTIIEDTTGSYYRYAIITVTSTDGSSVSFKVKQCSCFGVSIYHGAQASISRISFTSNLSTGSKPDTIDIYAKPGMTLPEESEYYHPQSESYKYTDINIQGYNWQAGDPSPIAIAHFAEINNVTGMPDIISQQYRTQDGNIIIPDDFVKIGTINGYAITWT